MLQVKFCELVESAVVSRRGLEPLIHRLAKCLILGPRCWRLVRSIDHACTRCVPRQFLVSFFLRLASRRCRSSHHVRDIPRSCKSRGFSSRL